MFKTITNKVFGTKHDREMKRLRPAVVRIGELEKRFESLDDAALAAKTVEFRERIAKGESLDSILPEAFAVCRLAGMRVLGMRHYDVQLIGGMIMHRGAIAEMRTGEGKTLTATLALYLNALEGKGAHLVTVNDYLAARDAAWMGHLYGFLGMRTGVITSEERDPAKKRDAYGADITYGTNNEFGFDYLRDNMVMNVDRLVQRGLHFAIVDEVDSILIDEARTPLIISSQAELNEDMYRTIDQVVVDLLRDEDYQVNEEHRSVALTDEGVEKVEERLGLDNLYDVVNIATVHHVNKALEAHTLYKKGDQYLVRDDKVVIVDEFTGRPMDGRRWSDGLHQAVEAKEGVKINAESITVATITYQNLFRMYDKLSGMTGTADTEAEEFQKTYGVETFVIPTNKPVIRKDMSDVIYRTEREKFTAIVDQILECYERGQPVLVGTVSVDKSEVIANVLKKRGIAHSVLNAKFHGMEAQIVAQAGRKGAITIATNMAGRGTDILLGGNPEALAAKVAPEGEGEAYERALAKFKEKCAQEKQEVLDAGGLFILGTERHDSRRIDNQLRGRAGRQGDPGASRFYLSLEDDLMRRFGAERIQGLMARLGMEEGVPIEAGMVNKSIENAQSRVEGRNFDVRKHLLEYDDVMDVQRDTIYKIRRELLEGTGVFEKILDVLEATLEGVLNAYASDEMRREDWDLQALAEAVKTAFDLEFDPDELPTSRGGLEKKLWTAVRAHLDTRIDQLERIAEEANEDRERLIEHVEKIKADHAEAVKAAEASGDAVPPEPTLPEIPPVKDKMAVFVDVAQQAYLRDLDQAWIDHLKGMRMLRDSVSLHGYAQKDPKQLYKSEGYELFVALRARINTAVSEKICRIVVPTPEQTGSPELNGKYLIRSQRMIAQLRQRQQDEAARRAAAAQTNGPAAPAAGQRPTRRVTMSPQQGLGAAAAAAAGLGGRPALPTLGRNDACWCGSGKKYKHCHMRLDQSRGAEAPKNEGAPPEDDGDGVKLV